MAKVLLGDVMHDWVLFTKGTAYNKAEHADFEHLFGNGEVAQEAPATPTQDDNSNKTKTALLDEISAVEWVTDEQLVEYGKLKKDELVAVHKELVG